MCASLSHAMFLKLSYFLSIGGNEIAQLWVGGWLKLSEKMFIHAPQGGSVSVESPTLRMTSGWILFLSLTPVQSLPNPTDAFSVEVHFCGLSYPQ